MSAFQRFLQDFAAGSSTLDGDSQDGQEYEDVECSQIYLPGLDETQIVDEEHDFPSLVRPGLIWESSSCTKTIAIYLFCTLGFRSATETRFCSSWFSVKSFSGTSKRGKVRSKEQSVHHSFYQTEQMDLTVP